MKKFLLGLRLLASLALSWMATVAHAQAPAWQSALAFDSDVSATATDAAGNIYVAGAFSGTSTFGTFSITSAGGADVYVAKWNPTSNAFVWVRQAGGTGDDAATALAVSGGNVYLAGGFVGTAAFGSTTLAAAGSVGSTDAFVAKLTDAGSSASFAWAVQAGGTETERASALAVNGTRVYVAGVYNSATASFGASTLTNAPYQGSYLGEAFVARLTDAGSSASFDWALSGGISYASDHADAVAVSGTSVYIGGSSSGFFGSSGIPSSFYGTTAFVAKLTDIGSSGNFLWALPANNTGLGSGTTALAASGSSVYAVGGYSNSGPGSSVRQSNLFIAKFADAGSAGSLSWTQNVGSTIAPGSSSPDYGNFATAVLVSGPKVYVAGYYQALANFGPTTLANAGGYDAFVARLTDAGSSSSFDWALGAGGPNDDYAQALALSGGTAVVAGTGVLPLRFGSVVPTGTAGAYTGYLARLGLGAVPLLTSLAPGSGPVGTSVTLTGTSLTGATGVTFNGVPATGYTVNGAGTQMTVPVPAGASTGPVVVTTANGASNGLAFTVTTPVGVAITGFTPASGVAGTALTLTGTRLTGTTAVTLNGTAMPGFVVNAAGTEITVPVPAGATTGLLRVSALAGTGSSTSSFTVNQPRAGRILPDGYRESRYGAALALQTTPTGFGNSTNGTPTAATNGSELDAAYAHVSGDSLYVFLAGNLEGNGNSVEVFFDSQVGGQNVLAANNPNVDTDGLNAMAGLTFDSGFAADYYLEIKAPSTINVVEGYFAPLTNAGGTGQMSLSGTARSVALNLGNGRIGNLAVDQSNTGGVNDANVGTGWPAAVVTGTEVVLPLAALGAPVGSLKVAVFVNGVGHNYLSNQTLAGLPNGTANPGNPAGVNFAAAANAGNQYFTVLLPVIAPVLTAIAPASGPVGTTVSLTGTNLTGSTRVTFAGSSGNAVTTGFVVNAAGTQLTGLVVPTGANTGNVTVTTLAGISNGVLFTMASAVPRPVLTSLAPASGPVGTAVTVAGTNLSGATSVSFNGTAQTTITSNTATGLTVTVPAGASTGNVTVTTPGGTSNGLLFTVTVPTPVVTTFAPAYALPGATLTVTGQNLNGLTQLTICGVAQPTFTVNAAGTQLTTTVPAATYTVGGTITALNSGPIRLTTPAGTATSATRLRVFNCSGYYDGTSFNTPPTFYNGVALFVVPSAPVYLRGSGFSGLTGGSFGAISSGCGPVASLTGSLAITNDSMATLRLPADLSGLRASGLRLTLTSALGSISPLTFTGNRFGGGVFVISPVASCLSPASGPVGTRVTLTGFNLAPNSAAFNNVTGVTFNGVAGLNFFSGGSTSVSADVPPGLTLGPVLLRLTGVVAGGPSEALPFTVTRPTTTVAPHAADDLLLYPNPTHGTATVRWPVSAAKMPLLLLDALGREVRRYPAPTGTEATLDLRGLPAGVYVLRSGASRQRLVVE